MENKTGHHSLEDWTFLAGNEYYLDETIYVGSPSSLATPLADIFLAPHYVFLNEAVSGAINDGQFVTAAREASLSHDLIVWFRQTNDLSSCIGSAPGDGYQARWSRDNNRIDIYRAGIHLGTLLATPPVTLNTWHQFKVLWYSYINPNLDRILRIRCYIKVNGDWQDCGYIEDSNPLHESDPVNRVGFAIGGTESKLRSYIDNTEIWEKPE